MTDSQFVEEYMGYGGTEKGALKTLHTFGKSYARNFWLVMTLGAAQRGWLKPEKF